MNIASLKRRRAKADAAKAAGSPKNQHEIEAFEELARAQSARKSDEQYLWMIADLIGRPEIDQMRKLKRAEAEAVMAGAQPGETPILVAEADVRGMTPFDLAVVVLSAAHDQDQQVAAIEAARIAAKAAL